MNPLSVTEILRIIYKLFTNSTTLLVYTLLLFFIMSHLQGSLHVLNLYISSFNTEKSPQSLLEYFPFINFYLFYP